MPHNGGKTQLNISFLGIRGPYAFLNPMLTATKWGGAFLQYDKHDANGYMHTYYADLTASNIYIPSQSQRPGKRVFLYDGTGTVTLPFSYSAGSGNLTGNGGRFEFLPGTDTLSVTVTAIGTPGVDYPHNFRFPHIDDEAALAADPYAFNPDLIALYSKIGVFRPMDWQNTNTCQTVNLSDATPITHYSYCAGYVPPGKYFVTTNIGDAYSATTGRGALVDGEQVVVKFSATSSGSSPTFKRDATVAKTIMFADGEALFGGSAVQRPTANAMGVLTYSSILDKWLKYGGDTEVFSQGINAGVPVEIILKFCKEAGCHPWFNIPYLALDTFKTYTTDLATYVKAWTDANAPWMVPRYEPSNEIWDFATDFFGTRFAWACELAKGYGAFDHDEWYGRALSKVGQALDAVYGGNRALYKCMGAVFVDEVPSGNSNKRFTAARYVTESGNAAFAAQNWCHTVTPAYYWSAGMINDATESALADAYVAASAGAKPALAASYLRSEGSDPNTPVKIKAKMATWQTYANTKSLSHEPYEGGFSAGRVATPATNIQTLRNAAYDSPELFQITQELHQYFTSMGGLYFSKFHLTGRQGLTMFDPDIYATPSQEWGAIDDFNHNRLRFKRVQA